MASKYFDTANMYVNLENMTFSGLAYPYNFFIYEDDFKETTVAPNEEFRADKIAYRLWDSQDLSWILDIINDFENGISDYTIGTIVKYLDTETLINIGII